MKIIASTILILFFLTQLFAQGSKIKESFLEFQTAFLNQDCNKLVEVSSFPILGDMGLAQLVASHPRINVKEKTTI